VPIQRAVQPERGVLLEHRPDSSFDSVINLGIEKGAPAQNIDATSRKGCAKRALNVSRGKAFGYRECR
jgi:hypothetical protein